MKTCPKAAISPPCPSSPVRAWAAMAPVDHELSDVLSPHWLGSRAHQFRAGDTVTILDEKQRFFVHLQLTEIHDAAVSFALLNLTVVTPTDTIKPDLAQALITRHAGTWAVLVGGVVIKKEFLTEAEAREWLQAKRLLYSAAEQAEG